MRRRQGPGWIAGRPARGGEAAPRPYMNRPTHHRCRTCLPRWGGISHFVGVRRCLTRRPGGPADRCQRVRWCLDHRCRGGRQRTPGASAPGSVRKPPEGGCEAHRRPGRSAGCRRRWGQPASAGLGTEPGRSRPGDRGEGRSADRRCVSGETCRPRCITAPIGAVGRGSASPLQGGRTHSRRAHGHHGGAVSRSIGGWRCLTHWPARAGRDTRGLSASVTERSPPARVCRAFPVRVARSGEAAPRPYRDRAPCSPVGESCATGRCHQPRLVGVRRCLTRRSGRAGTRDRLTASSSQALDRRGLFCHDGFSRAATVRPRCGSRLGRPSRCDRHVAPLPVAGRRLFSRAAAGGRAG